jgi:hypothetical protein
VINKSKIIVETPTFTYMKKLIFPALVLIFSGCYYNNQEALYGKPDGNCNATMAMYSMDILPILQTNCFSCHSAAAVAGGDGGGHNFEIFSVVQTMALNGKLVGSVDHLPGYIPMPQFGNKISNCDISKIKTWVNTGALNN